eukprot:2316257-Pleurochrysis_carterae.AAC.2
MPGYVRRLVTTRASRDVKAYLNLKQQEGATQSKAVFARSARCRRGRGDPQKLLGRRFSR